MCLSFLLMSNTKKIQIHLHEEMYHILDKYFPATPLLIEFQLAIYSNHEPAMNFAIKKNPNVVKKIHHTPTN